LKDAQIGVITAMTNPQQGLLSLPTAYTQVMELYRHSYLFPDKQLIQPAHIEGLVQQWQLPYEELYELFHLIGTKNSGKIADGISAVYRKDILQRYHIGYTQQLCRAVVQLLQESVGDTTGHVGEHAVEIECLRDLCDHRGVRE